MYKNKPYPSHDIVIVVVKQWVISIGTDLYECDMKALIHHWQNCIANTGDCTETKYLFYQIVLLCSLYLLYFSRKYI